MSAIAVKKSQGSSLSGNRLPKFAPWAILAGALAVSVALFALLGAANGGGINFVGAAAAAAVIYLIAITVISLTVEGSRQAKDRFVTGLVTCSFLIATAPLISVTLEVISKGLRRFDMLFFSSSMRNVSDGPDIVAGGALHAIVGTLQITLVATAIAVPLGLMTAVYLVEYGRGQMAKTITFLVDVMTGIPSIVAGLFAYSLFTLFLGPSVTLGLVGAVALTVLMVPTVVRSSEEMLRLVPNELREASYALGVPKWLTVVKVVLPTSIAGITTGIVLAIARVIGETAPLLITAGYTNSMNYNLFEGQMQSLPVFVFTQYAYPNVYAEAFRDRAWAAALVLILIVMVLNLVARAVAKFFAPKTGR
ncbi:MAG: phosphate ABC transporter permease PstA [Microbacteriaceae bacterium]|nr:phosphate ABC transporter permease PstA [Microbacteriaceae bacterium]